MGKAYLILALLAAAWYMMPHPDMPIPQLNQNEWWGPHELKGEVDETIRPFQITFDDEMVKDLKHRLRNHRPFTPPIEDMAFQYGFNTNQLQLWINYWAEQYNFTQQERFINKFLHFKTNIQGLDIHFIRVKPQVPSEVKVLPLMLIHGWPGSVREFYEAIPLLTTKRPGYDFVFEVIVPSLPGYGYSDAPVRPGLAYPQTAVIFKNLMNRLGHQRFYVQGGDWGATVACAMSTLYPDNVLGYHSNLAFIQRTMLSVLVGAYIPSLVVEPHLADRMYPLSEFFSYIVQEFGYFHFQATKPDTVGVGLTDSPSGLLTYILEKFSTWTNINNKLKPDGGLESSYTKDKLIDNLMMYWATNKITSSIRYYLENMSKRTKSLRMDLVKTTVPMWAYQARYELFYQPPNILKEKYVNLLNVTVTDDGGHFLALEQPNALVDDIFKAVAAFIEFHEKRQKTEL